MSGLVPPTGTKCPCPPLARLTVGPGTKATYCPGPKGNRDKMAWNKGLFCSSVLESDLVITRIAVEEGASRLDDYLVNVR